MDISEWFLRLPPLAGCGLAAATAALQALLGQQVTKTVRLRVPANGPPSGPYARTGSIGTFPASLLDESSFEFSVVE